MWVREAGKCFVLSMAVLMFAGCVVLNPVGAPQAAAPVVAEGVATWHFDGDEAGQIPIGWSIRQTNPTVALAEWKVTKDPTAPSGRQVLTLTETQNYNGTYNLAIADDPSYRNLDVTVESKAIEGEEDQGGGPIWRCRDEDNYYICRFNPLESNFRVYFVREGRRKQLQSATVATRPGRWYTIRATMIDDRITCYLNGEKLLEVTDDTFGDGGKVGLWTKADAVTAFDDLRVRSFD